MPFNVLRCFECKTFQIHPQTKASKWRCKMCNEKQSFLKVFMTGTAPECRQTVQTLNMRQGEMENGWERTDTSKPQFSRTSPQTRNTGSIFSSAGSDQEYETDQAADLGVMRPHAADLGVMRPHAADLGVMRPHVADLGVMRPHVADLGVMRPHVADLGVMRPLSSVHSHTSNSSLNSREVTRPADLVHRTGNSWLETQAVGKKPLAFHAASNHQKKNLGGSKWEKFLDPVDADDSSSEDDSGSAATARFHTPRSEESSLHILGSVPFHSVSELDEDDDDDDDDENFLALGFKHRGFYSIHP